MGSRFAVFAVLLCFLGCSSRESDSNGRGAGGDSFGDYPSGPYGTAVGDVLADLQLLGYLRNETTGLASEAALGPVSFGSIRRSTDKTHALIHISGFT